LGYRPYDLDLALGGLIRESRTRHSKTNEPSPERKLLNPDGEAMPATRWEILLRDLSLWGLNAAPILKGKPTRISRKK
jgi:hypothetical protein